MAIQQIGLRPGGVSEVDRPFVHIYAREQEKADIAGEALDITTQGFRRNSWRNELEAQSLALSEAAFVARQELPDIKTYKDEAQRKEVQAMRDKYYADVQKRRDFIDVTLDKGYDESYSGTVRSFARSFWHGAQAQLAPIKDLPAYGEEFASAIRYGNSLMAYHEPTGALDNFLHQAAANTIPMAGVIATTLAADKVALAAGASPAVAAKIGSIMAFAMMGTPEGFGMYLDLRENGVPRNIATPTAITGGLVIGGLEAYTGVLLMKVPGVGRIMTEGHKSARIKTMAGLTGSVDDLARVAGNLAPGKATMTAINKATRELWKGQTSKVGAIMGMAHGGVESAIVGGLEEFFQGVSSMVLNEIASNVAGAPSMLPMRADGTVDTDEIMASLGEQFLMGLYLEGAMGTSFILAGAKGKMSNARMMDSLKASIRSEDVLTFLDKNHNPISRTGATGDLVRHYEGLLSTDLLNTKQNAVDMTTGKPEALPTNNLRSALADAGHSVVDTSSFDEATLDFIARHIMTESLFAENKIIKEKGKDYLTPKRLAVIRRTARQNALNRVIQDPTRAFILRFGNAVIESVSEDHVAIKAGGRIYNIVKSTTIPGEGNAQYIDKAENAADVHISPALWDKIVSKGLDTESFIAINLNRPHTTPHEIMHGVAKAMGATIRSQMHSDLGSIFDPESVEFQEELAGNLERQLSRKAHRPYHEAFLNTIARLDIAMRGRKAAPEAKRRIFNENVIRSIGSGKAPSADMFGKPVSGKTGLAGAFSDIGARAANAGREVTAKALSSGAAKVFRIGKEVETTEPVVEERPSEPIAEDVIPPVPFEGGQDQAGEEDLTEEYFERATELASTPEFKAWFRDSKVVDENGKPLVVYHGTSSDFTTFEQSKAGLNTRIFKGAGEGFWMTDNPNAAETYGPAIMPVYLEMVNPLYVDMEELTKHDKKLIDSTDLDVPAPSDEFATKRDLLDQAIQISLFQNPTVAMDNRFESLLREIYGPSYRTSSGEIAKAKANRHDGVIFNNSADLGPRSTIDHLTMGTFDTYIVFKPKQIKSIFNVGTFDPSTPNTLFERGTELINTADARSFQGKPGHVYIGRVGNSNTHFGNPFSVLKKSLAAVKAPSIEASVQMFADWLAGRKYSEIEPERREWIINQLKVGALDGKKIHCFPHKPCHGDILIKAQAFYGKKPIINLRISVNPDGWETTVLTDSFTDENYEWDPWEHGGIEQETSTTVVVEYDDAYGQPRMITYDKKTKRIKGQRTKLIVTPIKTPPAHELGFEYLPPLPPATKSLVPTVDGVKAKMEKEIKAYYKRANVPESEQSEIEVVIAKVFPAYLKFDPDLVTDEELDLLPEEATLVKRHQEMFNSLRGLSIKYRQAVRNPINAASNILAKDETASFREKFFAVIQQRDNWKEYEQKFLDTLINDVLSGNADREFTDEETAELEQEAKEYYKGREGTFLGLLDDLRTQKVNILFRTKAGQQLADNIRSIFETATVETKTAVELERQERHDQLIETPGSTALEVESLAHQEKLISEQPVEAGISTIGARQGVPEPSQDIFNQSPTFLQQQRHGGLLKARTLGAYIPTDKTFVESTGLMLDFFGITLPIEENIFEFMEFSNTTDKGGPAVRIGADMIVLSDERIIIEQLTYLFGPAWPLVLAADTVALKANLFGRNLANLTTAADTIRTAREQLIEGRRVLAGGIPKHQTQTIADARKAGEFKIANRLQEEAKEGAAKRRTMSKAGIQIGVTLPTNLSQWDKRDFIGPLSGTPVHATVGWLLSGDSLSDWFISKGLRDDHTTVSYSSIPTEFQPHEREAAVERGKLRGEVERAVGETQTEEIEGIATGSDFSLSDQMQVLLESGLSGQDTAREVIKLMIENHNPDFQININALPREFKAGGKRGPSKNQGLHSSQRATAQIVLSRKNIDNPVQMYITLNMRANLGEEMISAFNRRVEMADRLTSPAEEDIARQRVLVASPEIMKKVLAEHLKQLNRFGAIYETRSERTEDVRESAVLAQKAFAATQTAYAIYGELKQVNKAAEGALNKYSGQDPDYTHLIGLIEQGSAILAKTKMDLFELGTTVELPVVSAITMDQMSDAMSNVRDGRIFRLQVDSWKIGKKWDAIFDIKPPEKLRDNVMNLIRTAVRTDSPYSKSQSSAQYSMAARFALESMNMAADPNLEGRDARKHLEAMAGTVQDVLTKLDEKEALTKKERDTQDAYLKYNHVMNMAFDIIDSKGDTATKIKSFLTTEYQQLTEYYYNMLNLEALATGRKEAFYSPHVFMSDGFMQSNVADEFSFHQLSGRMIGRKIPLLNHLAGGKRFTHEGLLGGFMAGMQQIIHAQANNEFILHNIKSEQFYTEPRPGFVKLEAKGSKYITFRIVNRKTGVPVRENVQHLQAALMGRDALNDSTGQAHDVYDVIRDVYAPERIARFVNNVTKKSPLRKTAWGSALMATNAKLKLLKVAWGMFHRRALLWSAMIAGPTPAEYAWGNPQHTVWEKIRRRFDYIGTREYGMQLMETQAPVAFALSYYGLLSFRMQDLGAENLAYKTAIDKWIARQPANKYSKASKEVLKRLSWWTRQMNTEMFGIFGSSLKMAVGANKFDAVSAKHAEEITAERMESEKTNRLSPYYESWKEQNTDTDDSQWGGSKWYSATEIDVLRTVAGQMNADFGNLNTRRLGLSEGQYDAARLLFLGPDWCVPANTRAMTKTGWKYHHELSIDDEIMVFDPKTGYMRWSPLKDKYYNPDYNGNMVEIKNWNRSIAMTPDHTCFVNNFTTGKTEIVKAAKLQTNHTIPRVGKYKAPKKAVYDDFMVKMVGWLVTDGHVDTSHHIRKDGTRRTRGRIKQAKPGTVQILKDLGLTFSVAKKLTSHGKYKDNYLAHQFTIPIETFREIEKAGVSSGLTAQFIELLTMPQRELLYETMLLGDGTGQGRFCGKEQEVFNMILLQTMMGQASTFWQQEENCWLTRRLSKNKQVISCWGHRDNKQVVPYSGKIWCPSTETGFWLAERNGLVFITGNTLSNFQTVSKLWLQKDGRAGAGAWFSGTKIEQQAYLTMWAIVLKRVAAITLALNLIMAGFDDETMWERAKKAKKRKGLKILQADISPIMHAMGGNEKANHYLNVGGQFMDPLKWVFEPIRSIVHKGSAISKPIVHAIGGQDYRNRRPTDFWEIPTQGLNSYQPQDGGPIHLTEIPSYAIQEIMNLAPIQLQKLWALFMGEENFISAMMEGGAGLDVNTAR